MLRWELQVKTHLTLVACVVAQFCRWFCFPLPSCHQHFPLCSLCQRLNSQLNVFISSLKEGFYHIFTNILVLPIFLEEYLILCLYFHLGVKLINTTVSFSLVFGRNFRRNLRLIGEVLLIVTDIKDVDRWNTDRCCYCKLQRMMKQLETAA